MSIGYMHTNSVELYNILHSCWLHIEPTLIIRVYIYIYDMYICNIHIIYTYISMPATMLTNIDHSIYLVLYNIVYIYHLYTVFHMSHCKY